MIASLITRKSLLSQYLPIRPRRRGAGGDRPVLSAIRFYPDPLAEKSVFLFFRHAPPGNDEKAESRCFSWSQGAALRHERRRPGLMSGVHLDLPL
jgi:hypothetical protein